MARETGPNGGLAQYKEHLSRNIVLSQEQDARETMLREEQTARDEVTRRSTTQQQHGRGHCVICQLFGPLDPPTDRCPLSWLEEEFQQRCTNLREAQARRDEARDQLRAREEDVAYHETRLCALLK